jgi:hypothetical protein
MTELLFNTTSLTDMGCTYRLFHQAALQLNSCEVPDPA